MDIPRLAAGRSGAPWARPIHEIDRWVTRFETGVATLAIALEASSMSLWVALKGLSTPVDSDSHAGVLFRSLVGATLVGVAAHWALRRARPPVRAWIVAAAVVVGMAIGRTFASPGVDYFANLLNFLQQASFLTLLGGLRGTGTRLTLLLALIGGSLATARGKHVVVDVVARLAPARLRKLSVVASFGASAAVAGAASWGFFDHIAIQDFGAGADAGFPAKVRRVVRGLEEDAFVASTQLALDWRSLPHVVLRAEPYAEWLHGKEWNDFLAREGFVERYGREATLGVSVPDSETRAPLVTIPGRGEPRGELINGANLVYPIGLLIIGLRFLVRGALVVGGHASVEADEDDGRRHEGEAAPSGA
jgi:TRAP-type C4-dicarboxylate transport system permease small subunit